MSEHFIPNEEALRQITKGVLVGLEYLHSQNICHRDIKPDNIMVHRRTNAVKLIDFGISKKTYQRGARREMLTVIGTPLYFAPEMLLGGGYDERVDLWALGITLFQKVTGYTPFESEYRSDTIKNIIEGKVEFEDRAWGLYTPFVADFVGRLLKQVESRMSLVEAKKHLWLQAERRRKVRKLSSHILILH